MKFLLDVNASGALAKWLLEHGYDLRPVSSIDPAMKDNDVLQWASNEERFLITTDQDFEEMIWLDAVHVRQVDASQDVRAEAFGKEVLSLAPQDAILFAEGDEAVFAIWYFHFALGERPDIVVVAADLLHFDWYQENLRAAYPALVVPGPFPWPETIAATNLTRPTC